MKLIIQIPCLNEEHTLAETLKDLPGNLPGIDNIETLIIDDGSTDNTVEVAKKNGATHIISFTGNRGLAKAFDAGIQKSLELGADIIVNTDGDNQYNGADLLKLIQPLLDKKADVSIGDRQTQSIKHFSFTKRLLQKLGTNITNRLGKTQVNDAVSGYRAFTREAALNLNILTNFSYTTESLIQLGNKKFNIVSVPIRTNEKSRESRLFKSIPHFLINQVTTIIRVYSHYKALKIFTMMGILITLPGIYGILRFLYYFFTYGGAGKIQSLIISVMLILIGVVIVLVGILADMISNNRVLIEKILANQLKYEQKKEDTI